MDDKEPPPSGARLSTRGGCECEVLWAGEGGGVHSDNQSEHTYVRTNAPETLTNAPASSVASCNIHALVRHRNHRAPVAIKETRGSAHSPIASFTRSRRTSSADASVKGEAHISHNFVNPFDIIFQFR